MTIFERYVLCAQVRDLIELTSPAIAPSGHKFHRG